MCLSKEHRKRHDDHSAEPAARPVSNRSATMPKETEMRQMPTPTPTSTTANTNLIPATAKTSSSATKPTATTPASKSKSVVVSQEDKGARSRRGTAATLPPRHRSVQFPLTEAPLNAASQPRQHSTTSAAALGKGQVEADEFDLESLQLTLSMSGSVTYATTPRMSRSSLGGVATRTKTRERVVVMDESGRRREYFR